MHRQTSPDVTSSSRTCHQAAEPRPCLVSSASLPPAELTFPHLTPVGTERRSSTLCKALNHGAFGILVGVSVNARKHLLQCRITTGIRLARTAVILIQVRNEFVPVLLLRFGYWCRGGSGGDRGWGRSLCQWLALADDAWPGDGFVLDKFELDLRLESSQCDMLTLVPRTRSLHSPGTMWPAKGANVKCFSLDSPSSGGSVTSTLPAP